jgi:hypothetical protein
MIGWARLRQWCCPHLAMYRVTVDGRRYFRCGCGYQAPQIRRSPAELEHLRAQIPPPPRAQSAAGAAAPPPG